MVGRPIVWLLLGIGLLACGAKEGARGVAPRAANEPLSLFLEPRSAGWFVAVNDSVQVAIFEILPTIGAGMVYPSSPSKADWLEPGSHTLLTRGGVIRRHRAAYLDRASGPLGGPPMAAVVRGTRPVVIGIACACELQLDDLGQPGGPREILGPFAGLNAEEAVPEILASVLPADGDPEWVMARR